MRGEGTRALEPRGARIDKQQITSKPISQPPPQVPGKEEVLRECVAKGRELSTHGRNDIV